MNSPQLDNNSYLKLITEIVSEYPNHTICYTDGSKSGNKTGFAYSIQNIIKAKWFRNSASVFIAELSAIYSCPSNLTKRPPGHKYVLLSYSLSSFLSLQDPYTDNPITQRTHVILQTLSTIKSTVIFTSIWIPSHIGAIRIMMLSTGRPNKPPNHPKLRTLLFLPL